MCLKRNVAGRILINFCSAKLINFGVWLGATEIIKIKYGSDYPEQLWCVLVNGGNAKITGNRAQPRDAPHGSVSIGLSHSFFLSLCQFKLVK